MEQLINISPLSGRYFSQTKILSNYFSEYGYIKYRLKIEIDYFIKLRNTISELNKFPISSIDLRNIYHNFTPKDALVIKEIEETTKHDVKAIEYFLKNRLPDDYKEFVHFGLTSQDINNPALSLSIKDCLTEIVYDKINSIMEKVLQFCGKWKDIPMLSRTHGQPASPTTLGKELYVFYYRLQIEFKILQDIQIYTKFGGAVGNLNAHYVAYPDIDWIQWCNDFIQSIGLSRSLITTQIDNYDSLSRIFDSLKRISIILTDMCQDIWLYISMNYFKLNIEKGTVGSSTMPHKVNPINFENAEGNLKLATNLLQFLSSDLPISRLQRDLTDSTVSRNVGSAFGHFVLALDSILSGCAKLDINPTPITQDLTDNPMVIAEAIQTILRKEGIQNPYEKLKALTQNRNISIEDLKLFINSLEISDDIKKTLLNITQFNYVGVF